MNLLHTAIAVIQVVMATGLILAVFWAWVRMNCLMWAPRRPARASSGARRGNAAR